MLEFSKDKGSKLDELKREISHIRKDIEEKKIVLEMKDDSNQSLQLEMEQLNSDILAARDEFKESVEAAKELEQKKHSVEQKLA